MLSSANNSSEFKTAIPFDDRAAKIGLPPFSLVDFSIIFTEKDRKICENFLSTNLTFEDNGASEDNLNRSSDSPLDDSRKRNRSGSDDSSDWAKPLKKRGRCFKSPQSGAEETTEEGAKIVRQGRGRLDGINIERERVVDSDDDGYDFDREIKEKLAKGDSKMGEFDRKTKPSAWKPGTFMLRLKEVFNKNSPEINKKHCVWRVLDSFIVQRYQRLTPKAARPLEELQPVNKLSTCAPFLCERWWEYVPLKVSDTNMDGWVAKQFPKAITVKYPKEEELLKAREVMIEQDRLESKMAANGQKGVQDRVRGMFTLSHRPVLSESSQNQTDRKNLEDKQQAETKKMQDAIVVFLKCIIEEQMPEQPTQDRDGKNGEFLSLVEENCQKASEYLSLYHIQSSEIRDNCATYVKLELHNNKKVDEKTGLMKCLNCKSSVQNGFLTEFAQPVIVDKSTLNRTSRKGYPYYKMCRLCTACSSRVEDYHLMENYKLKVADMIQLILANYRLTDPEGHLDWEESLMKEKSVRNLKTKFLKLWKGASS